VSSTLFYDPIERVVATLHPNHTFEKVVFDPWRQANYDVNDTVTFDPKADEDVGEFFIRLPDSDYLPTWYQQRSGGAQGPDEQSAAAKAAQHADTPTLAYFDTLGRPFLTIVDNGKDTQGKAQKYRTRVEIDIEGNQRQVVDAKGRIVMDYDYDMLGTQIHSASMEAGERWMLNNVAGNPIRAWDSRGFMRRMTYDELRRPTQLFVTENGTERLAERTLYGESQGTANNHRTRVYQVFDGAGVITNEAYDFKGNLQRSKRDLLPDYKGAVNWQQNPTPNDGTFTSSTTFDALNRPTAVTAPDQSVYRPTYNEANLLDKVEVNLRGTATAKPFVNNINYNAKGQRTLIRYANGAETTYAYDDQTFRLIRLKTTRTPGQNGLASQLFKNAPTVQDLRYTYDPAGNITRIADEALPVIAHDNQQVVPVCDYTYDAVYRLIEAKGREHIGQTVFGFDPPNGNLRDYPFAGTKAHPNDLQALRNYIERYEYDEVGNFEKLIHQSGNANWTLAYAYNAPSLIEPTKQSNRLSGTTVGQRTESYIHDAHGNMTSMPHLPLMQWDADDQLQATSKQIVNNGGTPETTWYVYDASGQRVRKVTERQAAAGQTPARMKERIYLGGFEIYREYENDGDTVTRERETLHVMDDQQRIALVETRTLDTAGNDPAPQQLIRYHLGNHLGSAGLELDGAGQIISCEEYHPYGSTSYQAGRSRAEVSLKRYRYTGKERDEETGFSYHGARYYAPWLGRWTATDPIGLDSGTNAYKYAENNPIMYLDQNGTDPQTTLEEAYRFRQITNLRDYIVSEQSLGNKYALKSFLRGVNEEYIPGILETLKNYGYEYSWFSKTNTADAIAAIGRYETEWLKNNDLTVALSLGYRDSRQTVARPTDIEALYKQRRKERAQAALGKGMPYVNSSLIAGALAYGASKFTDDPVKITAAAGVGAAISGFVGSVAQIGVGKLSMPNLSASKPEATLKIETTNASRAEDIHAAAGGVSKFRDRNPTAVLTTDEGVSLVAQGPTKNLSAKQRKTLRSSEIIVKSRSEAGVPKDQRIHPDIRVLVRAFFLGLTPAEHRVAGQPYCQSCAAVIRAFGGVIVEPGNRAFFGGPKN
jgi:RHS repeat-associated protein